MQEQVNEKISLLIDDELQREQALSLLGNLQHDPIASAKLQRFQLMREVLKNDDCVLIDKNFSEKIHQQIDYEPVWLLPAKKPVVTWHKTGLALAASITLAVVWLVHKIDKEIQSIPNEVAINSYQPPSEIDPRLNDYLQAHENVVYSDNFVTARPYARVVGYQKQ